MSDKEKFSALMQEFGIPFTKSEDGNILFIDTNTPKVDGCSGFFCSYEFTPEGKFVVMFIGE